MEALIGHQRIPKESALPLQHLPTMEQKKKKKKLGKKEDEVKQQKQSHKSVTDSSSFKPSSEVKGIRFGGQLVVKNFPVRRAASPELLPLLSISSSPSNQSNPVPFPSTIAFLPTNFTILAHHAWNTLTLGLGTKKSKILIFVFATDAMKSGMDRIWPSAIPLGEVNKRLIRGLVGCEMARFKFRKGCITFYVYAVRQIGVASFPGVEDLRTILESVTALKDFLDHTAMLAYPSQRSIGCSPPFAIAH